MDKLKPCPFCGYKAKLVNKYNPNKEAGLISWVECQRCDAKTGKHLCNPNYLHKHTVKRSAVGAWNRRDG